jgi:hypothetical protein
VAEENDAGLRPFLVGEHAIMIAVEKAEDGFEGGLSMAVFKDLNVNVLGSGMLHLFREQNGPVMGIVVAHEAANKADNDARGIALRPGSDGPIGCKETGRNRQNREGWEKSGSRRAEHENSKITVL